MNFEQFVGQNTTAPKPELPPLRDTEELSVVIVTSVLLCASFLRGIPQQMQDDGIDAIIAQVQKLIDLYIVQRADEDDKRHLIGSCPL